MTLYGAVEMGGTKVDVTVGTGHEDMADPVRIPTTTPDETLAAVSSFFAQHAVAAIGVASFGPLELNPRSPRYGSLLFTPKPGWSGVPVLESLRDSVGVPVVIDTDVNGAARGEGKWGAAAGMRRFVYVTVGTGIGAGIVVNGTPIAEDGHPEFGHIVVSKRSDDRHEGSCVYHGGCLEGMASGPALEARFGNPDMWAGNRVVVDVAVHYLAQGMVNLVYTLAPERIVVGGGVSKLPGFHDALRQRVGTLIAGYPTDPDLDLLVSAPGLGEASALAGAILMASTAP